MRLIDADALIAEIKRTFPRNNAKTVFAITFINGAPTIEAEPVKRGKWIEHYLEKWRDAPWGYNCSECGAWFVVGQEPIKRYHYCPNCGAKMDAEEADHASL